jgi:ribonuclease D
MSIWINTPQTLQPYLNALPDVVGLDTEFIRERTYWPQLALVQIALDDTSDDRILLLDALAPGMTDAIATLLSTSGTTFVMHSPSEDLVAFQHCCGRLPERIFDTQTAAALCGLGAGLGYQKLVQAITGIELSKGETRSDWLRRPLSESQLHYAADDVRHLHRLQLELAKQLAQLERSDWLEEDQQRQLAAASQENDPWPHLSMRSAQFLDAPAQRHLLRMLRWRDTQARTSDKPRSWILDNELAVTLARQQPADLHSFHALLDANSKSPRSLRNALWTALTTPLADEEAAPLALGEQRDKKQLRALQDAVTQLAKQLNIPEGTLASRRLLEQLQDGNGWTGTLGGWRKHVLEATLTPLLEH